MQWKWKYHFKVIIMRQMRYFLRTIFMKISGRNCDSCVHYDGKFGEDCCFQCEYSITGEHYERR